MCLREFAEEDVPNRRAKWRQSHVISAMKAAMRLAQSLANQAIE
jgi:hypothetical protein